MRADAKASQALIALAKAVDVTFSRGDWIELGLLTDTDDLITGHRRLLRSLEWGDADYSGCVLDVLPRVLGERDARSRKLAADRYPNLRVVADRVGLERWLAENEPGLHHDLYGGEDGTVLDDLEEASSALSLADIDTHAARIRKSLRDDPAQAIGSAKELLETTMKAILGLHGTGPETRLDIPELLKKANILLGLDAAAVDGSEPGAAPRRRVLGSLAQVVNSTGELRNAGLGTGHGSSQGPLPDVATARMVVSAAVAVSTFYIEVHAATDPTTSSGPSVDIPF